jgi:hypothetical protein
MEIPFGRGRPRIAQEVRDLICCCGCPAQVPGSFPDSATLTCATKSGSLQRAGGSVGTPIIKPRPTPRTMSLFVTIAPFRCNLLRRPSSRRRIATARATRSHACASFPELPPISEPLFSPGRMHSRGSAGARGAPPCGAGNAIRTKEYRDVEGSLLASPQSLSPQSLDIENTPLVYSARGGIGMRRRHLFFEAC